MSSKKIFFVSFLCSILIAGCNLRFGDSGEPEKSAQLSVSQYPCLTHISDEAASFVNGEMSSQGVQEFSLCLQRALKKFAYYSKGKDQKGYQPQEIVDFLNSHFLKKNQIRPSFTQELMKLKVLAAGGSSEFVSHGEFNRLIEVIDLLGREAERHLPYVRLYGMGTLKPQDPVHHELVRNSQIALRGTAEALAQLFSKSQYSYKVSSLESLIEEFRQFLNWQQFNSRMIESTDLVGVIAAYKKLLTGSSSDTIHPQDWKSLFVTSADLIGLILEYQLTIRKEPSFYGAALERFIQYVEKSFNLIQQSLQSHSGATISFADIDQALEAFDRIKFLPMGLRAASLKPVVRLIIGRVLRDPTLSAGAPQTAGLTTPALNEARKEFYIWADSQRYISQLLEKEIPLQGEPASLQYLNKKDLSLGSLSSGDPRVQHIVSIMKNVRPLFKDRDPRVWIVPADELDKNQVRHNLTNLGRLNVFGSLMRVLIRGFASRDRVLAMSGLTVDEMENFYQSVKALGMDLKLMDPRSKQVGIRSFQEGNMFTFSGNGLQDPHRDGRHLLSFYEGIELLAFIWSGGQVRNQMYEHARLDCGRDSDPSDIFGNKKVDRQCFLKAFEKRRFIEFSNLPRMRAFIFHSNGHVRSHLYSNMQEIASIPCEDSRFIEQAEMATISTILHYIESLFAVYDRDKNGILNGYEILASFPRFHQFLDAQVQKVKGKNYDVATLKSIFAFLVEEGRFPDSIGDKTSILWKRYRFFDNDPEQYTYARLDPIPAAARPSAPRLSLDRSGFMAVLAMLNRTSKESGDQVVTCPKNGRSRPE